MQINRSLSISLPRGTYLVEFISTSIFFCLARKILRFYLNSITELFFPDFSLTLYFFPRPLQFKPTFNVKFRQGNFFNVEDSVCGAPSSSQESRSLYPTCRRILIAINRSRLFCMLVLHLYSQYNE